MHQARSTNVPMVPTARLTPHPLAPSTRQTLTRWRHRHAMREAGGRPTPTAPHTRPR